MILTHKCYECGFKGEVKVEGRKVKCPRCGTENDFWLEEETPPENHHIIPIIGRGDNMRICIGPAIVYYDETHTIGKITTMRDGHQVHLEPDDRVFQETIRTIAKNGGLKSYIENKE